MVALLVLVALIVLGIVGYILVDSLTGSDSGGPQSMPAPPPAAEDAAGDPEASAAASGDVRSFASPSGNISCTIEPERARCVISSFDYEPPEEPEDCAIDNWGGVIVANSDGAGFSCLEAPEAPKAQMLDYGESIEAHGIKCTSQREGMTCVATDSGTGFTVARAGVSFLP
ncbi:hypothetical protein GCM10022261_28590 [Brevibacterium daeguense]|uniref:Subtilisin inhibitor-like n=1 Tax=Brevibacterium daeguense TaxID=909936 RepID=A0ABP8ENM2_9MICO|nr:DUF6636 domain-containing protein [Brevibacterium daeguense]